MSDCGMKDTANGLMTDMTTEVDLALPDVDLSLPEFNFPDGSTIYDAIDPLTNESVTTRAMGGSGTFDAMMAGVKAHLDNEWDKGRIAGNDYSKVFLGMSESALQNSVQFLINKDASFWAAQTAQLQAITARVMLESEKAKLITYRAEALTAKASYALAKAALAKASVEHCTLKFTLDNLLPTQNELLKEQVEVQLAQTSDTRKDGSIIVGTLGKQKDLYAQQIQSYKRSAEQQAAKIFTDAWTVMKTIDEGLTPPTNFANANIDTILASIKTANNL